MTSHIYLSYTEQKTTRGTTGISSRVALGGTWGQLTTLERSTSLPSHACLPTRAMMVTETAWMAHPSACRVRIAMQT